MHELGELRPISKLPTSRLPPSTKHSEGPNREKTPNLPHGPHTDEEEEEVMEVAMAVAEVVAVEEAAEAAAEVAVEEGAIQLLVGQIYLPTYALSPAPKMQNRWATSLTSLPGKEPRQRHLSTSSTTIFSSTSMSRGSTPRERKSPSLSHSSRAQR